MILSSCMAFTLLLKKTMFSFWGQHDSHLNGVHQCIELLRKCEWISLTSEEKKNPKIAANLAGILTDSLLSLRLWNHSSIYQLSIIVRLFYCGRFFCIVFAHFAWEYIKCLFDFMGADIVFLTKPLAKMCKYFNIFGNNKIISVDYLILYTIIL